MQKGCGYHLDMLVVGLMTGLCSLLELFRFLYAERMRIPSGHTGGEPDDWSVLGDGAALVSGHHTAKMLLNVVF